MNTINNGGYAFPSGLIDPLAPEDKIQPAHSGMTLRDVFAAKALLGIMGDPRHNTVTLGGYDAIASCAYLLADSMIKAREGGEV